MYQPGQLNSIIEQARLRGDKEIVNLLTRAHFAMDLANHIHSAHRNEKAAWRSKCEVTVTFEDLGL